MTMTHEQEMAARSAAAMAELERLALCRRDRAIIANALQFFTETRAEGVTRAHAIRVLSFLTATDPVAQTLLGEMLAQEPDQEPIPVYVNPEGHDYAKYVAIAD
jgi:hypothetical protein